MRKILIVLGKDVHNKSVYKIYKECLKRGYCVAVFATTLKDGHINIFRKIQHEIRHINDLNEQQILAYDYIFSAVPIYNHTLFRDIHKYIFMNPSTHLDEVYFSSDFVFTVRDISKPLVEDEHWPIEHINFIKSIPGMATGGPQYEKLEIKSKDKAKKILFIDSGHFPFGTKKELAQYIIKIAESCLDYEVCVKPRYLPKDTDTTHKNKENLYEYFDNKKNLPKNLTLIRKHTDLKEELEKVDLVICSEGTSSYEEIILANKKILIFTGFPNKENLLWNPYRIDLFNKIANNLPCRVNYQDIFKYLPQGIRVNTDILKNSIYKTSNVAEDIVDAMEYIYINFVSKNIFPERTYYKSNSYLNEMKPDYSLTWDNIIERRYRLSLYDYVAEQVRNLVINMDYSKVFEYIDHIENTKVNEEELYKINLGLQEILFDTYIKNSDKMMKNSYSQSLLCLAYFKKNKFNEFQPAELKCKAYYAYCLAKIEFDCGDYENALNYINDYFDEVDNNLYEISYADDQGVKDMAHFYKGAALFHLNDMHNARIHLDICDKAWRGKHKKAAEYLHEIEQITNSDS